MAASLPLHEIDRIINMALAEDIGRGDITSSITLPDTITTSFSLSAREQLILCGLPVAARVFNKLAMDMELQRHFEDGAMVHAGDVLLEGEGNALAILAAERTALNLLCHMSGVATFTHMFVQAAKGTKAKILDTRKTLPGLRILQKYAVEMGGGVNHRFRLDDGILIKDNHIALCGGITEALRRARAQNPSLNRIEVECDNLDQVKEALDANADMLLLDNMDTETLRAAVEYVNGQIPLEASGGVTLEKVPDIAATGVDFISVGMITHSPYSVDIGLDIDRD